MTTAPRLSVCLITKNEEAHLPRCLSSLRGLWDELIVADTGSTDRTVAIAEGFGARVVHVPWQDDFSLARNGCLSQATGDWILSIDADETIAAHDHAAIRAQIARPEIDAVTVAQRHYLAGTVLGWQPGSGGYQEGEPYSGYLDTECRRLFRHAPWLRWENRVHEVIVSRDPARPIRQIAGGWVIHHFGKVGDREVLRGKAEHYLRILLKKVEDRPNDPQTHHELGVQYHELRQYDQALAAFRRVMAIAPGYSDTQLQIAMCHVGLGDREAALAALAVAARTLPACAAEVALVEGNLRRDVGDPAGAERAYRRGLAKKPAYAALTVNLALLQESQGRHADARTVLDRTLAHLPGHSDVLRLRAQVRRALGDVDGALADLAGAGRHPAALRLRARLLAHQGRFTEAQACLDGLDGLQDADLDALRGAVALGSGDPERAAAVLRRSLDAQPTYEVALNLSIALEARGSRADAAAAAATAAGLMPADPIAGGRADALAPVVARTLAPERLAGPLTWYFYQPSGAAFDARTPRTRGLGGTESAVVYLAEALTAAGHRVRVFNSCDEPGCHDGVEYARWERMPARALAESPDVLVAIRDWRLVGRCRLAPLQVFWSLDASDQTFLHGLADPALRRHIDRVVVGSRWQADTFVAHHDLPAARLVDLPVGAAATALPRAATVAAGAADAAPRGRRLAYTSTPFRGLDVLLTVFPRIRAAVPDAELDVYSSMKVYGWDASREQREFGALYEQARQPGVHLVGTVPQPELAARLRDVRVLAYPNHYAETFCIAAIEAQAAGCVVVTSQLGALPQTVGDGGLCLPGDARGRAFQDAFVNACIALLTDDTRWGAMSSAARRRAWTDYAWATVAARWEGFVRGMLAADPALVERVAVHLAAGRAALAQKMLEREEAPAGVPFEAWAALRGVVAARSGNSPVPPELLTAAVSTFPSLLRTGALDSHVSSARADSAA